MGFKKDGGMSDPVHIFGHAEPERLSVEERIALDKARATRRGGYVFLGLITFIIVGFLTPLFIWLSRLAGGW